MREFESSMFFLCKQKTAYEMRISDWSSDVCSSDLTTRRMPLLLVRHPGDAPGSLRCNAPPAIAGGASMDKQKRPPAPETGREPSIEKIGRASCRERVCQYV